jgi:NADPH:quinone reductase-like Zn-dependent oxidoreductase
VSLQKFEVTAPLAAPDDPVNACWQILVSDEAGSCVTLQEGTRQETQAPFRWRVIAEAQIGPTRRAEAWPSKAGAPVDIVVAYARAAASGAKLGPTFQVLSDVVVGDDEGAGWAQAPSGSSVDGLHPALLDAGLQLANLALGEHDATYVPVAVETLEIGPLASRRVRVKARVRAREASWIVADIVLEAEDGAVVASLAGARLALATADAFRVDDAADTYTIDWSAPLLAPPERLPPRRWAVLGSELARQSNTVAAIARRADAREIATVDEAAGGDTIVLFADAAKDAAGLAALVNAISVDARLVIVTRGAVVTRAGETADVAGAALWGLASVIALERPELGLRLLDLDPSVPSQTPDILKALESTRETRLALRGETLLAPRMRRLAPGRRGAAYRVTVHGEGLEGVKVAPFTPPTPGPGEVRVKIGAAGVNFRDALVAIGMYVGTPVPLGVECAGIIDAVGPGVESFHVGDRVFGFAPASHATHAIARADMIALTPDGLSDIAAASLPSAYLTADIGLRVLGRMQRGDRVLIHAATGGVGLAAVALAQRAGAEIHATAGSPEKRALLKQMGVAHVYDSRSMDYADQILEATRGEGVRIALNSLTGPFVGATLRALAPGGVLLELGKREIWSAEQVSAARPDVTYHVYDTGSMMEADRSLFAAFVRDLVPAICAGDLPLLRNKAWPLSRAAEAFRWMAQARHVGKIMLVPDGAKPLIREDATYLITGGLGGLGLFSADWLAEHGARRILLVGRTTPNAAAQARIAALAARGVSVRVALADVADEASISALMTEADAEGAPVRGVVHAAGVAPDRT